MKNFLKKLDVLGGISCLVAGVAVIMTTACVSIYHEPEIPEELLK